MKEYLVTGAERIYIVLAKDAKDAINHVWEDWCDEGLSCSYDKSDLFARSLGSLHNEYGKVARLC